LCDTPEDALSVPTLKLSPVCPEEADQVMIPIPVDIPIPGAAEGHTFLITGVSEGYRIEVHHIQNIKFIAAEDCHREQSPVPAPPPL